MFERFSERARQAIVEASEAARGFGHPFIAPEHLLLGLVKVGAAGDLSAARVSEELVTALGPPAGDASGQIPFRPAAQACLERARDSTQGQVHVGHVLLALLEDGDVVALVERSGGDVEQLRAVPLPVENDGHPLEVTIGDELIGDLGNPRVDVRVVGAILRKDGLAAGWLRTTGVDEAWVREFGG